MATILRTPEPISLRSTRPREAEASRPFARIIAKRLTFRYTSSMSYA
jgi:hypothetical protein